ncbi:unnamed protein product [Miscanthus lutarioriparius]|uniref:Uncharacterized protein n=1 Tax=Miscanthus lutarioriparius TaxID=422564 RepID=A0A811NWD3_9POAL|nr:unnamed protein product [Miscanthus lutarioriparius]
MAALVEARDGGAGGTESYDADAGYFREGSPAARLHPKQLLLPTPTRGISTTPQKVLEGSEEEADASHQEAAHGV